MAGEFEIIEKIKNWLPIIGDDCAELLNYKDKFSNRKILIASTDAFVEDVHFERKYFSYYDIGYKSLAASMSDIAACGGTPRWSLVSLGIPQGDMKIISALYKGMRDVCKKYGGTIVGGDTVYSPKMFVSVTAIGETEKFVRRSGAKIGDIICITGALGGASAGLTALKNGIKNPCIKRQLNPNPRIKEGKLLAKYATAMIDISDGLIIDLSHILEESQVSAKIFHKKLPIEKGVKEASRLAKISTDKFILSGGEDYELLFTVPPKLLTSAKKEGRFTEIGEILPKRREHNIIDENGTPILINGFDHFSVKLLASK